MANIVTSADVHQFLQSADNTAMRTQLGSDSVIENVSVALKALNSVSGNYTAETLGYYAKGDGGGGRFYWDSTSTETDNGGTIIQANGVATGRWKRVYDSSINLLWFGAKPDGVTPCHAALQKAIDYIVSIRTALNDWDRDVLENTTGPELLIPRGNFLLQNTITLPSITMRGSGKLTTKFILDMGISVDAFNLVSLPAYDPSYADSAIWAGDISDLTFQGSLNAGGTYNVRDILVNTTSVRGEIYNVNLFLCMGYCMQFVKTIHFTAANIDLEPRSGSCLLISAGDATSAEFSNCYFHRSGTGKPLVYIKGCIGLTFIQCIFESVGLGTPLTAYALELEGGFTTLVSPYFESNSSGHIRSTQQGGRGSTLPHGHVTIIGGTHLGGASGLYYKDLSSTNSVFTVTDEGSGIKRYTWTGVGTNPNITTGTVFVGSAVEIDANTSLNAANQFPNRHENTITAVGDNYFELYNTSGVAEVDKSISNGTFRFQKYQYLFEGTQASVLGTGTAVNVGCLVREYEDQYGVKHSIQFKDSDVSLYACLQNWNYIDSLRDVQNINYQKSGQIRLGRAGLVQTREIESYSSAIGGASYPFKHVRKNTSGTTIEEKFTNTSDFVYNVRGVRFEDASSGSEDSYHYFKSRVNGASVEQLQIGKNGKVKLLVDTEASQDLDVLGNLDVSGTLESNNVKISNNGSFEVGNNNASTFASNRIKLGYSYLWVADNGSLRIYDTRYNAYTSVFTSTVDSWTSVGGTLVVNQTIGGVTGALQINNFRVQRNGTLLTSPNVNNITVDVYIPASNTLIDGIQIRDQNNSGTKSFTSLATDTWHSLSFNHSSFSGDRVLIYGLDGTNIAADNASNIYYIKNFKIDSFNEPADASAGVVVGTQTS